MKKEQIVSRNPKVMNGGLSFHWDSCASRDFDSTSNGRRLTQEVSY